MLTFIVIAIFALLLFGAVCEGIGALIGIVVGIIRAIMNRG